MNTVPLVTSSQRLVFWCIRRVFWRSFLPSSGHKSISDRRHVTGFSQPCPGRRCYDREQLLSLRFIDRGNCVLSRILDDVSSFNLLRYRGSRAGRRLIHRRSRGVQEPVECVKTECTKPITVRITPRPGLLSVQSRSLPVTRRDRTLVNIRRRNVESRKSFKVGYLNAQSIGNKFALISDCISSSHYTFFAVVET